MHHPGKLLEMGEKMEGWRGKTARGAEILQGRVKRRDGVDERKEGSKGGGGECFLFFINNGREIFFNVPFFSFAQVLNKALKLDA